MTQHEIGGFNKNLIQCALFLLEYESINGLLSAKAIFLEKSGC